jgi:iron complex outermembrane recepter protein
MTRTGSDDTNNTLGAQMATTRGDAAPASRGAAGLRSAVVSSVVFGLAIVCDLSAHAQSAQPSGSAAGDTLETIIVSAQRRSERAQDVPITITNIRAADLEETGTRNLSDIATLTPGLRFDYAWNFVQPTIRGVGTAISNAGGGSNVGTYIDGFYSPNPIANDFQLLNVDSIQVLKGPQGTLFGRNTTGGAILVNTAKPSFDTDVMAEASYGNFAAQKYQGYFTTGWSNKLAFDVAATFGRGDGFIHNITTGDKHPGAYENFSIRTGVLFTPTDDLSFLFRYTRQNNNDPSNVAGNAYVSGGVPQVYGRFIPGTVYTSNPNQVAYDEPVAFKAHANIYQLTSAWDFGAGTLTSYTQFRKENSNTYESLDYVSAQLLNIVIQVDDRTFTQEFLAASKPGSRLQWSAGAFYSDTSDQWPVGVFLFGAPTTGGLTGAENKSYATYADLTYQLADNFFITGGVRYTHDEVTEAHFQNANFPVEVVLPNLTSNRVTPRAVLRYALNPESSIYASFSRGYKAAIYNVGGGQLDAISPESLNAYEVGYKYAARGLSANVSGFFYDYKNLQVESYTTINNVPASIVSNAASARIWGFDGDIRYDITHAWEVNGGANYTHANYTRFVDSPSQTECLAAACGPAAGLYLNTVTDASGFNMLRSPRFTANLGSTYSLAVAQGKLALSANYYYTTKIFFDSSDQLEQGAYSLLGLRAAWTDASGRYTAALFGNNVTNTHYRTQVLGNTFGIGAIWGYPATYGASFAYRMR